MSDINDFPANPEPMMSAVPEVLDEPVIQPQKKNKTTTWIIIAVLILILLCCCCLLFVIFGFSQIGNMFRMEDIFSQFSY